MVVTQGTVATVVVAVAVVVAVTVVAVVDSVAVAVVAVVATVVADPVTVAGVQRDIKAPSNYHGPLSSVLVISSFRLLYIRIL